MEPKPSEVVESLPGIANGLKQKTRQKTISKLTDFCVDLQKKQKIENEFGPQAVSQPVEQVSVCACVCMRMQFHTGIFLSYAFQIVAFCIDFPLPYVIH